MSRIEKTVFISYRRANLPWALFIYQNLTMHGYDVFFDYLSIDSGNFERVIIDNIKARAHFLIILTPSALERCKEPSDWLRREIETAIEEKRNIVPLMMESFDFGSPIVKESLTGKLSILSTYNGLRVPSEYALEAMDRLRERFLNVALSDISLPTLQAEAQEITVKQKEAASEALPIEIDKLSAQDWFERGYIYQHNNNFDEACRCYLESIRLQPNISESHNNLGIVLSALGRFEEAEVAYRKAIELRPTDYAAYTNLGNLLFRLKRNEEAEKTLRKATELDPTNSIPYSNFGLFLHKNLKQYSESEAILRKAIELNPSNADAYYNLGNLLLDENVKRFKEAETAYRKAIEIDPAYAKVYGNLGNVLMDLKREEEAEVAYRKAIELDPGYATTYFNLGTLLKDQNRYHEAEFSFRKAIEHNPLYVKCHP
jgi:Flp pilus assembly protein TadD